MAVAVAVRRRQGGGNENESLTHADVIRIYCSRGGIRAVGLISRNVGTCVASVVGSCHGPPRRLRATGGALCACAVFGGYIGDNADERASYPPLESKFHRRCFVFSYWCGIVCVRTFLLLRHGVFGGDERGGGAPGGGH